MARRSASNAGTKMFTFCARNRAARIWFHGEIFIFNIYQYM